ncbi:hypothetical protein AMC87_PB00291 (plasmid) [Rhizobium phaseoli]|uniref:DUF4417 domain-containing protein n=1 Tax=Rhizobium phaseoli TaxID=396 RepID=UPI0007E9EFA7|nr:DUF4417 domain-containing protein [Rhizobium phaseoli]ANL49615.1 hypothetical protein AMC87_PB00291 [Rhizobium phaseoli]
MNKPTEDLRSIELRGRRLTDDPHSNPMLLGCYGCPQLAVCGGLHVSEKVFDCLALCCGNKAGCTQVCPNAPERFVKQRREIDNFSLDNVQRTMPLGFCTKIDVAALIYHGSNRAEPLSADAVALRLADLVSFKSGSLKFSTREQLCGAFQISPLARIIVSGVDHDNRVEPWWTLGERRQRVIPELHQLGIELVTVPNFSVVMDVPRTDNFHAMKRIALMFAEFQKYGLVCALHPNGRTEFDFQRWANFISTRPEVEVLSYEFITGPGLKARREFHLNMLAFLAQSAGRPLDLVVRGDPHVLKFLRPHFRSVVYIDTTAFVKTMRRRKAKRIGNLVLDWPSEHTAPGELLDHRLQHNVDEQVAYLRNSFFGFQRQKSMAA